MSITAALNRGQHSTSMSVMMEKMCRRRNPQRGSTYDNAGRIGFIPSHRSQSRSCFTHYPARKPLSQRDLSRYEGVLDLEKSIFEQTHQCSARFLPQLRSRNGAFLQNASIALVIAHQVPWFPFLGRHNSIREPQRYVKTALGTCIAAV